MSDNDGMKNVGGEMTAAVALVLRTRLRHLLEMIYIWIGVGVNKY